MDLSSELSSKLKIDDTDYMDDNVYMDEKEDNSGDLESPMSTRSAYDEIDIENNTSNMIDLLWIKNIKETFGRSVFIFDFAVVFNYIDNNAKVLNMITSSEHELDEYVDYIKTTVKKNKNKVIILSLLLEGDDGRTNNICVINKEFTLEMFEIGGVNDLESDIRITDMIMKFSNKLGLILCRPNKILVQAGDKGYFTMFSYWYAMMRVKYNNLNYNDFINKVNEKMSSENIIDYIQKYILKLDDTASIIASKEHVRYDTFDNLYGKIYPKLDYIFGKYFN
jgi:hypothetical protein